MRRYGPRHGAYSHASLEGYIVGRLITMAASRALELYGWPLTRASLLDAIFRDIRTFKLYDYTLGPYGDGVGWTGAAQTEEDWCNQGAHEVFMTGLDLTYDGALTSADSFRFSGCSVQWNDTSLKALIGYKDQSTVVSDLTLSGLSSSTREHNSENSKAVAMMTTTAASMDEAIAMVALPESYVGRAVELVEHKKLEVPLVAPFSGLQSLRAPFQRGVVNLFASYYQEARTAASFLINIEKARKITLVWNSATHSQAGKDFSQALDLCQSRDLLGMNLTKAGIVLEYKSYANATDEALSSAVGVEREGRAFIVVASDQDALELMMLIGPDSPIVLSSVVSTAVIAENVDQFNSSWMRVYMTSRTPALGALSSSNTLRQNFENWVSFMDVSQEAFEGFLVGRFISAVISDMDQYGAADEITADKLLDTIYSKKYFKIDNTLTVGPFIDDNSGERACNQGMDTTMRDGV
eukprot:m51a1_g13641 hypothetical protein (467) ;mRNA; f:210-1869